LGLGAAEAWWKQVEASRRLRLERVDSRRQDRARAIFFRHSDKDFSFTDCTSFVIMQEMGIGAALTLDRHFHQMGFRVLPGVK
jgi:predicted nucleic acid-binding protein